MLNIVSVLCSKTESYSDMVQLAILSLERTRRQMTREQLATAAGISLPTLRGLERGSGNLQSLGRVMRVLELEWGWAQTETECVAALSQRRHSKGMSQAELAQRVGCVRQTVIAIEKDLGGSLAILLSVLSVLGLQPTLRLKRSQFKGSLIPPRNAPARDLVMTPTNLAAAILAHFGDQMSGRLLDPARGKGAFFDQFPTALDRDWCELSEGRDFLEWNEPAEWIVTNPPWSRLRDFTRHAMTLAPNIIWLAPIVNLTTKARLRDLEAARFGIAELLTVETPRVWPQSGFQLAAVHIKKGHRGDWKFGRLATP